MVLSKREKLGIYLMVVVIFIYLIYTYGLTLIIGRLESVRGELLIKKVRLGEDEALLKDKARLEKDYNRLGLGLKSENKIPDILRELSGMTEETGLRIRRLRSAPYREGHEETFLEMDLEGDMNGLAGFLQKLEGSPHLLTIGSLRIRPKQDNPIELDIHLLLSIKSLGLEGG